MVFLYENKNTQELKEFVVERTARTQKILDDLLEGYVELNKYCEEDVVPPRCEGASKSTICKWCNYKNRCWVV